MLEVNNLSKSFPIADGGRLNVVADVSFTIETGKSVALVGRSGCGKSTVLRMIAGLDKPDSGSIDLDHGARPATEAIGVVFQEPRLLPWANVRENVRLGLLDMPKAEQDERIHQALKLVDLHQRGDALPKQLSGGMAQRVGIARALARRPSLLLLDEPFSALDAFTKASLQEAVARIQHETHVSVLLVTHDVEEAVYLADKVLILAGKPGGVADVVNIDLPHPRDKNSDEAHALRRKILNALKMAEIEPSLASAAL